MTAIPIRSRARRPEPVHVSGEVRAADARGFDVQTPLGLVQARLAASCLLRPEPGDKVLVSGPNVAECYVIAVLERQSGGTQHLHLSGDTLLSVEGGSLKLASSERLDLQAGTTASVSAAQVDLRAAKAQVLVGELSAIGRVWTGTLGQLRFVGEALDSVVQRLTQHAKHSLRTIEQTDQVRSGQIDYRADGNANLQGQNTLIHARELVKINGDQVHVG